MHNRSYPHADRCFFVQGALHFGHFVYPVWISAEQAGHDLRGEARGARSRVAGSKRSTSPPRSRAGVDTCARASAASSAERVTVAALVSP